MTNHYSSATCQWFALCDNASDGNVKHPTLGLVPTCQRCADKLDLTLLYDPDNPHAELLPDPDGNWHESHDNVVILTRWMADDGRSAYEVADAVEKPWKFTDEYKMARYDLDNDR